MNLDILTLTRSIQRLFPLAGAVHEALHNGGDAVGKQTLAGFATRLPTLLVFLPASKVWETLEQEPLTQRDINKIYDLAWYMCETCGRPEVKP